MSGEEPQRRPTQLPAQIIPRPVGFTPGPPAPWSDHATEPITIDTVVRRLGNPVDWERRPQHERESAVLALFFAGPGGEARVVLTRRSSNLRNHRSEVSFPGGRVESGETLLGAALREAWEEISLDPRPVEPIGTLTPLMTFSSQAMIHPFTAILPEPPVLRANPAEVELVFDVALADLLASHHSELWAIGGEPRLLHFFELPADIVWGATGRMLWEVLCRLTVGQPDFDPAQDPIP